MLTPSELRSSVDEKGYHNVYCLQRISAYDRLTNAVRVVIPDVMSTAAAMDAQLEAYVANTTDLPLLFCVPILLKDNYDALDGLLASAMQSKFQM